jgi:hypothetical protein
MTNQNTWWEISDEDPNEEIGRYVENAFGAKEIVHLDRISWAYLDWLAARGCDVDAWIRACDMQRHDNGQEFTDALFNWVYLAYKDREELGLDRPEWCPPFQG